MNHQVGPLSERAMHYLEFWDWWISAPHRRKYDPDHPATCAARETWAYLTSRAPVVPPADYKLVPVEPTEPMIGALLSVWSKESGYSMIRLVREEWDAALAAAPSVGVPLSDERIVQLFKEVRDNMGPTNLDKWYEYQASFAVKFARAVLAASLEKK